MPPPRSDRRRVEAHAVADLPPKPGRAARKGAPPIEAAPEHGIRRTSPPRRLSTSRVAPDSGCARQETWNACRRFRVREGHQHLGANGVARPGSRRSPSERRVGRRSSLRTRPGSGSVGQDAVVAADRGLLRCGLRLELEHVQREYGGPSVHAPLHDVEAPRCAGRDGGLVGDQRDARRRDRGRTDPVVEPVTASTRPPAAPSHPKTGSGTLED